MPAEVDALKKFRKSGKFVIAHSQGFDATGLGDYLTAASADQITTTALAAFRRSAITSA